MDNVYMAVMEHAEVNLHNCQSNDFVHTVSYTLDMIYCILSTGCQVWFSLAQKKISLCGSKISTIELDLKALDLENGKSYIVESYMLAEEFAKFNLVERLLSEEA